MNFEDEEYVRLYSRETVTSVVIGWEGRAVLWHLMIKCDRRGLLEFDRHDDAVDIVSLMTGIPTEVVIVGLGRLLNERVLSQEPNGLQVVEFEGRFINRRTRHWSKIHYAAVYERDGETCRYCGCSDPDALSVDHVTPRCLGGTDGPENLVVACMDCNRRKGGRTPQQAGMVLQ